MSQIDQAFIKAYRTQLNSAPNGPAPASTLQRGSLSGQALRVDAPHVQGEPIPPAANAQRVPTPHLQLKPEVAARLSGLTGRKENAPTAPPPDTTQRWSAGFRPRSNFRPAPENAAPPAAAPNNAESQAAASYPSVEETLMRLVGIAEAEMEPEEIQIVTHRVHHDVEVARPSQEVEQTAPAVAPAEAAAAPPEIVPEPTEETAAPAQQTQAETTVEVTTSTDVAVAEEQPQETEESRPEEEIAAAPSPPTVETLQPAWEVDNFHWPDVVSQLQTDPIAGVEAVCKSLRDTVGTSSRMLAVSGVENGVGATTVSLLLARGLAKLGLNVALVDADFEDPTLAESLGVRIQDGWEAAIDGRLPLEEVCVASLADGVTLVPLVQHAEASATKASLNAAGVLKQLRDVFDIVLIDAGTGSENVAAVATSSDEVLDVAVLLAVDERQFDAALTSEIVTHLRQFSIESIQMVQTFVAA